MTRRHRSVLAIGSLIGALMLAGTWYLVEWFQDLQWHR